MHVQGAPGAPRWRWAATEGGSSSRVNGSLVMTGLPRPRVGTGGVSSGYEPGLNFTVYLPTYAAVASLRIGVEPGASLRPLRPYAATEKPILVWGSSIAQGGVVTNAGMTWPSNLQRILDRPLLNFGFSGSCEMQPSVAAVLGALKPSVFVMDCLPNMQQDSTGEVTNATLARPASPRNRKVLVFAARALF